MMRDSRGRFVNRRTFAAEVLLEVVTEVGLDGIRGRWESTTEESGDLVYSFVRADPDAVTQMLAEATRCADLLLAGDR